MNWFIYLVKTPWLQKKQDWTEFIALMREVRNAEIYLENAERRLLHSFFEEEAYAEYDSCLKERVMFVRMQTAYEQELIRFNQSRCQKFTPIGNEKPCECLDCGAYDRNRKYFNAKQEFENITKQYKTFWKNKFNQQTK